MSQIIPIYIPTYISDQNYNPTRVLPRLFFYNGLVDCETYYIESGSLTNSGVTFAQNKFPYFDNYNVVSGSFPTIDSDSLLFNNEAASYGEIPIENLYTKYWETYVSLLYNPRTRLFNCEAIIPLADYYKMELNDIVEWRGNYYHLRAINEYNLKNGECKIQLLGPLEPPVISNLLPELECVFNFTSSVVTTTTTTTTTSTTTTTTTAAPTTTTTTAAGLTKTLLYEVTQSFTSSINSESGSLLFNFNDGSNPPVYGAGYYEYVAARNIPNGNNLYSGSITLVSTDFTSSQGFAFSYVPKTTLPFVFANYNYEIYTDTTLVFSGSCSDCNSVFVSLSPSVYFNPIASWNILKVKLNITQ